MQAPKTSTKAAAAKRASSAKAAAAKPAAAKAAGAAAPKKSGTTSPKGKAKGKAKAKAPKGDAKAEVEAAEQDVEEGPGEEAHVEEHDDGHQAELEAAAVSIQRVFRGSAVRRSCAKDKAEAEATAGEGAGEGEGFGARPQMVQSRTVAELCAELVVGTTESTKSMELEEQASESEKEIDVKLHLYDIGQQLMIKYKGKLIAAVGTGIFHVGVEVNGQEYSYGYVEKGSGVFAYEPEGCEHHFFRTTIPMKATSMSGSDIAVVVSDLSNFWHGASYDMLKRNCCHFCSTLCRSLGAGEVPAWLMNLAGAGACVYDEAMTVAIEEAKLNGGNVKAIKIPLSPSAVLDRSKNEGSLGEEYISASKAPEVKARDIIKKGKIVDPKWKSGDLPVHEHQRSASVFAASLMKLSASFQKVVHRGSVAAATSSERLSLKAEAATPPRDEVQVA